MPRARRHYPTDDCLEKSLAQGEMCDAAGYGLHSGMLGSVPNLALDHGLRLTNVGSTGKAKIDIVWSWFNSTDPYWRRTNAEIEAMRHGRELTLEEFAASDHQSQDWRFEYAFHHLVHANADNVSQRLRRAEIQYAVNAESFWAGECGTFPHTVDVS
jgi:hypothetical protein